MHMSARCSVGRQQGFTLIEVLVSILVLMVGILGISAMQMISFQTNQSAYMRSQATYLAQDMMDRIRSNRVGFQNSTVYDSVDTSQAGTIPASPACISTADGCSSIQLGEQDIREWAQNFGNFDSVADYRPRLLGGRGTVTRGSGNEFTVLVEWDDRDYDADGNLTREAGGRSVEITAVLF